MAKTAWVFPGQGSQYVGMASDAVQQNAQAGTLVRHADELLGVPLSQVMIAGPEDELRQTKNTQPAIFVHSMALVSLMQGPRPDMVAGHSLGEYSALVVAGALSFDDGLRLVRLRGELMQRAGEIEHGTMAAVIGLDPQAVQDVCTEASSSGIVQPANFNSPGQVVISGSVDGVRAAMALAKARGAKMVKELVVSGAFHSPLMRSAQEGLRNALATVTINDPQTPVYTNVTADAVTDAKTVRRLLLEQLTSPVRWEESVVAMIRNGATSFVEIGPGKVLQGLIKRIDPAVTVMGIDRVGDIGGVGAA